MLNILSLHPLEGGSVMIKKEKWCKLSDLLSHIIVIKMKLDVNIGLPYLLKKKHF